VAYVVLAISTVLDLTSIRQSAGQLSRRAAVARVDIDDSLGGAQVKALVRGIESGMKHESDSVYRADIVPIGRAQAAPPA